MRLLVLFDLPVVKKADRKAYARFRRFLLNDGYDMLQFSVYARLCNGEDALLTHVGRLKINAPPRGSVRYLRVTEKQYARIEVLVGTKTRRERQGEADQLVFF